MLRNEMLSGLVAVVVSTGLAGLARGSDEESPLAPWSARSPGNIPGTGVAARRVSRRGTGLGGSS